MSDKSNEKEEAKFFISLACKVLSGGLDSSTKHLYGVLCTSYSALENTPIRGNLKSWVSSMVIGTPILTVQISRSGIWAPGYRLLTSVKSTYMTLDESRRDFSEVHTLYADDNICICYDPSSLATIVYSR